MQPFCSTTTGSAGGSKVRSPRPSDTNTITFCRSPFASAITSCAMTGEGCCLAHTGYADMLIGLAKGALPSKRTVPRTVAPVGVGGGPPARTERGVEMQTTNRRAAIDNNFFKCIPLPPIRNWVCEPADNPASLRLACAVGCPTDDRVAVSALIPGDKRSAIGLG